MPSSRPRSTLSWPCTAPRLLRRARCSSSSAWRATPRPGETPTRSPSGLTLTFPGQRLLPGGTALLIGTDQDAPFPNSRNILREIDLAGNAIRETNLNAVNAQLTAKGQGIIYSFNHDVQRLPNGGTAVIGLTERTVNINGTPTDYVGMMVMVLDADLQVAWAWDAFDHLDENRGPVLGEVLQPGSPQPTASVPR